MLICEGIVLSKDEKVLAKVKEILKKGEAGVKEIAAALKKKGFSVGGGRLRDILNDSVKKGILTARRVGKTKRKVLYGLNLKTVS